MAAATAHLPLRSSHSATNLTPSHPNITATSITKQPSKHKLQHHRETGYITKRTESFGIIQCFMRDALISYSKHDVLDPETLSVGDMVEFELAYAGVAGHPQASNVCKMASSAAIRENISQHRLRGYIIRVAKPFGQGSRQGSGEPSVDTRGWILFELSGVFYYIHYHQEDCESYGTSKESRLNLHDIVSFHVTKEAGNKEPRALNVVLESASHELYNGVITLVRGTQGMIKRRDNGQEVVFHINQVNFSGLDRPICVGDGAEFCIERDMERGMSYATNIFVVPHQSYLEEFVLADMVRGVILRTLYGSHLNEKLVHSTKTSANVGYIIFEPAYGTCISYSYMQEDVLGGFTLYPGDIVIFNIVVDQRCGRERATNIQLLPESFTFHKEERFYGKIISVSASDYGLECGYIRCAETMERIHFRFSESLDNTWTPALGDEVEFSKVASTDNQPLQPLSSKDFSDSRFTSIRIRPLPKGTVNFKSQLVKQSGCIVREPALSASNMETLVNPGIINCFGALSGISVEYLQEAIVDCKQVPRRGDIVEFYFVECLRTGGGLAYEVCKSSSQLPLEEALQPSQGYIATMKDSFGFIEASSHDHEIFFHCSSYLGDFARLSIGDEVQYTALCKNGRMAAHSISLLSKGTVSPEVIHETIHFGVIKRPLRLVNPNQEHYSGLVQLVLDDLKDCDNEQASLAAPVETYDYGVTGLADPCDYLQTGDRVTFKLATVQATGKLRATCVTGIRTLYRARVHCIKHGYGFLDVDVPSIGIGSPGTGMGDSPFPGSPSSPGSSSGRKLFFHASEVHNRDVLRPGDLVEYVLIQNQLNGRYAACSIRKVIEKRSPASTSAENSTFVGTPSGRRNGQLKTPHTD